MRKRDAYMIECQKTEENRWSALVETYWKADALKSGADAAQRYLRVKVVKYPRDCSEPIVIATWENNQRTKIPV